MTVYPKIKTGSEQKIPAPDTRHKAARCFMIALQQKPLLRPERHSYRLVLAGLRDSASRISIDAEHVESGRNAAALLGRTPPIIVVAEKSAPYLHGLWRAAA